MSVDCFRETRWGGLVRHASKGCRFSHHPLRVPKGWHRDFAACGQRSGLLALNLANIFEKLLDQKTFVCLRLVFGKPFAYGSARLGHIPSLPLKSQLPLKPCSMLQPSDFEGNCDFSDFLLDFCYCSLFTLCKGQLAPCTPRRAEPARPHFACGSYLTANSFLQIPC